MTEIHFDRTADTQYAFLKSKESIAPLRVGLMDWLKSLGPTHYLTLNFHGHYAMINAEKLMNRWFHFVHCRLYKEDPGLMREEEKIKLLGYPEYTTGQKHIHYHCFVYLPPDKADWFCKIAEPKWKSVVKSGTLHIRPFDGTDEGLEKAALYSTKSSSAPEWYVPEVVRADRPNRVLH